MIDLTDTKTELDVEQELLNLLDEYSSHVEGVDRATTFEMLLTDNRGVIVRLTNGAEFQLSIVQSRRADNAPDDDEDGDDDDA
jgi:hypothetical protein